MFGTYSNQSLNKWIDEGDLCYTTGRYRDALRWYNQGLKIDKNNIILLTKKGNTLSKLHRDSNAYYTYVHALINANVMDFIDLFITQDHSFNKDDVNRLTDLLIYKHKIPITGDGVQLVLKKTREDLNDSQRIKTWKKFEKKLMVKHLRSLEEEVDVFLQEFGEQYYKHFMSLYCYLCKYNKFSLTMGRLIDFINQRKKMIELEQFERLVKAGVRKKGESLDLMTGIQFENYLATFFECCGYEVTKTKHSHDRGTDLILKRFGETIVVQAKRWKQKNVGTRAIEEVVTAQRVHGTQRALVVTTSTFTKPAKKIADKLDVELWDRKRLLDQISNTRFNSFGFY